MQGTGWRRTGGALLVVGGVVEAVALGIGSLISPPSDTVPGAGLLVGYAAGWACIGAGLLAGGRSLAGRGRVAMTIAGALALVVTAVDAVETAAGAPLGPAPSLAASALFVVALVAAAARLLSDSTQRAGVRWSMAVPSAALVLVLVGAEVVRAAPPAVAVLPWAGMAAGGALLLGSLRPRDGATAEG
jgi:hypothetical protein